MTSDKKNISLLAELFVKKGLSDIIISPGSRNAPVIISFANKQGIRALSIVDERSSAFFALGMAQQLGKAVAVACTSGSAALNYAPAIAEAYYQKIPLLVLTADRPPELIDQGYGQTIRQRNVYENYIKASFELPVDIEDETSLKKVEKIINEAINLTQYPEPGPVHINIPFREPLYGTSEEMIDAKVFEYVKEQVDLKPIISELSNSWNNSDKVLIVAGQQQRDDELNKLLSNIVDDKKVTLLSETTSNLNSENFIDCIDNVISTIEADESTTFKPDLLITYGGQVVSKMIKKFLRDNPPDEHWHISPSGKEMDTYFRLKQVVPVEPNVLFNELLLSLPEKQPDYLNIWLNKKSIVVSRKKEYLNKIAYSDLKIFDFILSNLPSGTNLHLGNSTPVRYSQLFGSDERFNYFSNRGVSGIDGQISTAAGSTYVNNNLNVLITGDLGFFYDSNGLMNNYLKPNLKIIVVNNSGGGIFRFIEGPSSTDHLEEFFETRHSWKAEKISEAFDVKYYKAKNIKQLNFVFTNLINDKKGPSILEIFTPPEENAEILKEYFNYLKR